MVDRVTSSIEAVSVIHVDLGRPTEGPLADLFEVWMMPKSFLFRADGTLLDRWVGPLKEPALRTRLSKH